MYIANTNLIPPEALAQLSNCTSAEELVALAGQYNIPLTYEEAQTVLMTDSEDLTSLNGGCGDPDIKCPSCGAKDIKTTPCSLCLNVIQENVECTACECKKCDTRFYYRNGSTGYCLYSKR